MLHDPHSYVCEKTVSANDIMGCCISFPSFSSYPTRRPDLNSSSRIIASSEPQSQAALPQSLTHTTSHSDRQETQECQLKSPHCKTLQRHVWISTDRTWTSADLDRERTEFFDTRTSGRPEVWQTLKAVLEILWAERDSEVSTTDIALVTAQQILDAAEIIVPHSSMFPGVYDSFGAYYPIPKYIISNPTNLEMVAMKDESDMKDESEKHNECDEEEALRRREEKGKNVMNPQNSISVRAKLSDRDAAPCQVLIGKEDSVRLLALKIAEESAVSYSISHKRVIVMGKQLPSSKTIKIAYMGKILKETQSLRAQGWKEEHVVNALVFG